MVRLLLLLLLVISGCNSKSKDDVSINTAGIFTPVSFSYKNSELSLSADLGEYLIGTGPKLYVFTVRNNSLFPLTELGFTLENNESFGFGFNKGDDGKAKFPGKTGTCSSVLNPGQSCTIVLQFETSITKIYEQPARFTYLNYVEGASRDLTLIVLAGNPASLIFDGEETNYYFGELVGLAEVPVIEREIDQEYSKTLRMTNAGDLPARNLSDSTITISQTCTSALTKSCPAGAEGAYRITHNCPTKLAHNESCEITLYFRPKNQAAVPEQKNVRYDSITKIDYQSSLEGTEGILNAYATTNSVNIEALFETSIESLIFENKIVVGNRDFKSFRINNRGFKEGFLRAIIAKDKTGAHLASCVSDGSEWLKCYNQSLTTALTLAQFPFKIKDKQSCFGNPINRGTLIPVDQGCSMDLWFQPSVTYTTQKYFDLEMFAEFDSLWKGNETITVNQLHTFYSESIHAALMVPNGILYNGQVIAIEIPGQTLTTYNAGRVGLMSPSYYRRKNLQVTFRNIGGVPATSIVAKDGKGQIIPRKETNPVGVNIPANIVGVTSPFYYEKSLINTSNCDTILAGDSCVLQFSFAPIATGSRDGNNAKMFDYIDSVDYLKNYKQFIMTYEDGTHFTDGNFATQTVDSGPNQVESRLKMDLVVKGQLDDYSSELFLMGTQAVGTSYRREIKFTNIGTAPIPYLAYRGNKDLIAITSGTRVVATDNSKLSPSIIDCMNVFDFRYKNTDTYAIVDARSNLWDPLDVDQECILTLEYYTPISSLTDNDVRAGIEPGAKEPGRKKYLSLNGSPYNWEWSQVSMMWDFVLDAYDGDLTDPTRSGPFKDYFGKIQLGKVAASNGMYYPPAKLSLYNPHPVTSAIVYRGPFDRGNVYNELNALIIPASTVPAAWFFTDTNESSVPFAGYFADIHLAHNSKNFIPSAIPNTLTPDNYEHVLYLGSVPSAAELKGSVIIANSGYLGGALLSATITPVLKPSPTAVMQFNSPSLLAQSYPVAMPMTIVSGPSLSNGLTTSFFFKGDEAGYYAVELELRYRDGSYEPISYVNLPIPSPDPRVPKIMTKKILVVAEVNQAPDLQMSITDYDVATDDINPAVETLGATYPYVMGRYEQTSDPLVFSSIKIPTAARKDTYIKRKLTFVNPSATTPIRDMKIFFRTSATSTVLDGFNAPPTYYLCYNETQTNASLAATNGGVAQPMCHGSCPQGTFDLPAGTSCDVEIRYQPSGTTSNKNTTLTVLHKQGTDRYVHRNVDLSFIPENPAVVVVSNRTSGPIKTTAKDWSKSYATDFGTVIQNQDPQPFVFNGALNAGTTKMLSVTNTTTTKASFLSTYQQYYRAFINPAMAANDPLLKQVVPAAGEYNYTAGGESFALIYRLNYAGTNNARILVYANKQCLVGDDTGQWFKKGFLNSDCRMIPILNADVNYINRNLDTNNRTDMDTNHVVLTYYNSNRASTDNLILHFVGTLKANTSYATGNTGANFYEEVQTSSNSGGQVFFKWKELYPATPGLGLITGYRIYFSPNYSEVSSTYPIPTATNHIDTAKNGTGIYQLTHNNQGTNKYMYYRILPIRSYAPYNYAGSTFGLPSGQYLSDANLPVLTVVIPTANFFYSHATKLLIEKNVYYQDNYITYATALTKCSGRVRYSIMDGALVKLFNYAMITIPAWNVIAANPTASSYNIQDSPVWLNNSSVNIHSTLLPNPEYNPTVDLAYLSTSKIFYAKKSGCGTNCSGNTAMGAAFGQPGYTSYVEPAISFAGARCYIQL